MSNVLLSIAAGRASDAPATELITLGRYHMEEETHVLEYDETELSGASGTTTTIRFGGDTVSMERSGTEHSLLTIEKGKQVVTTYDTPFGIFSVGFLGTKLDYAIAGQEGKLELQYHMDLGKESYANRLEVNFHPTVQC